MADIEPSVRNPRIIVIGAGMAGLLAAIRLEQDGYGNFVLLEKAGAIGGTWRENHYPGLTCDIPSHAYTYSFEPNPEWTQLFPSGPEIYEYFLGVTEKYGVSEKIRFNTEVVSAVYEDVGWTVTTRAGSAERADVIIVATGILHHPNIPDIAGLDRFAGAMFHSARWDHAVPLDGRRVGVIGSGSTGVQIVAALAGRASMLTHFQRTPQWIRPTVNTPFSEEDRAAFRSDPALLHYMQSSPELQEGLRAFTRGVTDADSPEMAAIEKIVLDNLENSVKDDELREKLRPDYRAGCKRMVMSPDYYEKIQLPGVKVATDKAFSIEEQGVRTSDGQLHELDVLVLATGFSANSFMRPMNVVGLGGSRLDDVWGGRPSAYLAISIPNFPNLFMLNGPSAPFGNFSSISVCELQMNYVLQLMNIVRSGRADAVSVKPEAMRQYDSELIQATKGTIWASGCRSWYLDPDGIPTIWPFSYDAFIERTAKPVLEHFDLVLSPARSHQPC